MGKSASKVERGDYWRPDDSTSCCEICERKFTLFRRRHHCRVCGGLFCDDCSKARTFVPDRRLTGLVRTCNLCSIRQGACSASSDGGTPRALTPRAGAFRNPNRDSLMGGSSGGGPPSGGGATLGVHGGGDDRRLCSSAPTPPPQGVRTGRTPGKKVVTSLSRQSTIFNPARRRALFQYLLGLQRVRAPPGTTKPSGSQLPAEATNIIIAFLSQASFLESVVAPPPRELYIARNKCSCIFGAKPTGLGGSKSSESLASDDGAGTGVAMTVKHTSAFLTPSLPSDQSAQFHFRITAQKMSHFLMEVGVVHQSFLPGSEKPGTGLKRAGSHKGGFGANKDIQKLLSSGGNVRVRDLSSVKVPPVGVLLPSRLSLRTVANIGSRPPSEGVVLEEEENGEDPQQLQESSPTTGGNGNNEDDLPGAPVDVPAVSSMSLTVLWDGFSRTATFICSEFAALPHHHSAPGSATTMKTYTQSLELPAAVSGKWALAISAEAADEVKVHLL